ncbi:glycosyltransferase [Clostridium nigeriense]|uniref:glycosyltransferase n=1 Tax=Clostridium nigeriense TaxID=1805470 RepID=UPI003D35107B
MINIGIVDTISLKKNKKIFGHWLNTALQYKNILSKDDSINIFVLGGPVYKNYIYNNYVRLPFDLEKKMFDRTGIKILFNKLKAVINTIAAIKSNTDILIFQDANQTILYTLLRFFKVNKKIYLIKYSIDERKQAVKSFNKIKNKISGVITSLDEVGRYYKVPYLIVPDYFPSEEISMNEKIYDLIIVGTVTEQKDYENVIKAVNKTKLNLKIVGYFNDEQRFNNLKNIANHNIVIENKYISDDEYKNIIKSGKYVILPYKKESYNYKSSGVVLDAIYNGVPVIVPGLNSFEFVKNNKVGLTYNNSFDEIIEDISDINYDELINNVKKYCKIMELKKEELRNFIYG